VYDLLNGSVSSDIIIDALDVLCAQLTHDLFAIAKFVFNNCNMMSEGDE